MARKKKVTIYIFILLLIVLYIVIYLVPSLTGVLQKTEILQYGTLQVTDQVQCFFVRNEKVYLAANQGTINYYIEDGTQVRRGTAVLSVTPSSSNGQAESAYTDIVTRLSKDAVVLQDYVTEFNGEVSYYIDGYESFFSPDRMRDIHYDEVKDLSAEIVNTTRTSTLSGEPLYKVCESDEWYLMCWVEKGNISKYEVDGTVTVQLALGDITATVADIIDDGENWKVLLRTNRYYKDFAKKRVEDATVITSDYSGIVVPNESITSQEGKVGVFIKAKSGDYVFKQIKVVSSDGQDSIVEADSFLDAEGNRVNTVEIYDEILRHPSN